MLTPPPAMPYCIISTVRWGSLRTMKVPEAWIPRLMGEGWQVVAKDTDMQPDIDNIQSNPRRSQERIDNRTDEGDTPWAV